MVVVGKFLVKDQRKDGGTLSWKRMIAVSSLSAFVLMAVFIAGFLFGYDFHRDLMDAVDKGVAQGIAQASAH